MGLVCLCARSGASIMEADDLQVITVSQANCHSTIGTRQTEFHEALPSLANDEVGATARSPTMVTLHETRVCQVLMVEWQVDCENCHHLTVVDLHDTGPWC